MRVNQTGNSQVQETNVKKTDKSKGTESTKRTDKGADTSSVASTSGQIDSVKTDISDKGKEFARVKQVASDAPDVREAKIAALKARIAEGKYKVDSDAVADRMVDEHLSSGIG